VPTVHDSGSMLEAPAGRIPYQRAIGKKPDILLRPDAGERSLNQTVVIAIRHRHAIGRRTWIGNNPMRARDELAGQLQIVSGKGHGSDRFSRIGRRGAISPGCYCERASSMPKSLFAGLRLGNELLTGTVLAQAQLNQRQKCGEGRQQGA
jgi:hypothetical protein